MKNSFQSTAIIAITALLVFSSITANSSAQSFKTLSYVQVPGTDKTFDINYQVGRKLVDAEIQVLRKSITFTFAGKLSGDTFVVVLPNELIRGPFSVWADKNQIVDFEMETSGKNSILSVPMFDETEQVKIVGSSIAGEYFAHAAPVMNSISGSLDKTVYVYGDTIKVLGEVSNPRNLSFVTLSVLGPSGNTIISKDITFTDDFKFDSSIPTGGLLWQSSGKYTIKVAAKDANTFSVKFDFVPFVLPDWVKTNAGWWSNDQIDDSTFATGLQYLIKEKIVRISDTKQKQEVAVKEIPSWVKTNAGWWNQGLISDSEFVKGIEFLIQNKIIAIS